MSKSQMTGEEKLSQIRRPANDRGRRQSVGEFVTNPIGRGSMGKYGQLDCSRAGSIVQSAASPYGNRQEGLCGYKKERWKKQAHLTGIRRPACRVKD